MSTRGSGDSPSSPDDEKAVALVDHVVGLPTSDASVDGDEALKLVGFERAQAFSDEYNAALRSKLDWVIMPLAMAIYFTQYIDKVSVNYASVMDFPLVGGNYNMVTAAFYIGFLVWEFPTNYIAQRLPIGLAKYLGANIVVWGVLLMCHSATTSFAGLFVLRFLLGMLEACVAPTLIVIITMFYRKNEQATRICWFAFMNGVAIIFGGFVAYGVSFYHGTKFLSYQIFFLVFGALALVVGVTVLLWLPDSPLSAKFLSKEERIAVLERVRDDQSGTENKHFKNEQAFEALKDVRSWLIVLTVLCTSVPNGAITSYSNIVIRNFGYTSQQTLILATPAGAISALTTVAAGYWSDKRRERMLPIVGSLLPTILGCILLIAFDGDKSKKGVLLFGAYLIGCFGAALPIIFSWNASNIAGHTKKLTVNSMALFTFAIGNIIGTQIFQSKDAPGYIPGKIVVLVLLVLQIFISFLLRWINLRMNRAKSELLAAERAQRRWTDEDVQRERERHAFLDMTDKQNLFFVYTA